MSHPTRIECPSDEPPRFALCATAIVKNEASYIEEWLAYHRAVGVEHFFIFDNNSEDAIDAVLVPWINYGVVTLLKWPLFGGQIDAYNFALRHFGHVTNWMIFIDVDEFVLPKRHQSVPAFLETLADADQVLIPWRNFGYSGHKERPPGLVIESYTTAQDIPTGGFAAINCKAIVRPAAVARFIVHNGVTKSQKTVNERGERIAETHQVAAPTFDQLQINHYYTKSYAEMQAKVLRGQADGGAEKPIPRFDRPGFKTEETAISAHLGRTRAVLEDMRLLTPSPFRYGARRGLQDFTRRDPMLWLQRVSLANHLNRTPYLQMAIPLELKNLAAGRTLLVREEDYDAAAEPCNMERSIHIRDLCRRLQATTVWNLGTGALSGLACRNIALAPYGGGSVSLELLDSDASISVATPPDVLRCYSVIFAMKTVAPCEILITLQTALEAENVNAARPFTLPGGGTYVCIAEINPEPQPAIGLTLTLRNAGPMAIELRDLMVIAYG